MSTPLKLKDIAARISAHLRRLEANKDTNPVSSGGTSKFYQAGACQGSKYVRIKYVSYQYTWSLERAEAERYLAALDSGFTGRHGALPKETP